MHLKGFKYCNSRDVTVSGSVSLHMNRETDCGRPTISAALWEETQSVTILLPLNTALAQNVGRSFVAL